MDLDRYLLYRQAVITRSSQRPLTLCIHYYSEADTYIAYLQAEDVSGHQ